MDAQMIGSVSTRFSRWWKHVHLFQMSNSMKLITPRLNWSDGEILVSVPRRGVRLHALKQQQHSGGGMQLLGWLWALLLLSCCGCRAAVLVLALASRCTPASSGIWIYPLSLVLLLCCQRMLLVFLLLFGCCEFFPFFCSIPWSLQASWGQWLRKSLLAGQDCRAITLVGQIPGVNAWFERGRAEFQLSNPEWELWALCTSRTQAGKGREIHATTKDEVCFLLFCHTHGLLASWLLCFWELCRTAGCCLVFHAGTGSDAELKGFAWILRHNTADLS